MPVDRLAPHQIFRRGRVGQEFTTPSSLDSLDNAWLDKFRVAPSNLARWKGQSMLVVEATG